MLYLTRDRTKGKKARTVPVNSNAAKAIRALRRKAEGQALSVETSTTLFPSRKHGPLGVRQANEVIGRIFERAKIGGKVSPHSFRKTAGTLLSRNTPLPVIQEILGHADISTTRKYISVGMDSLRDATDRLSKAY